MAQSRREILCAVGTPLDLVLVRGVGNRGDELIWAGARALLADMPYREVGVDELPAVRGHTALICGSGAFCHQWHDVMPRVLAIAELRFQRVILLPSTFDTSVAVVRAALERTRAVVFAREEESYRRIQDLCEARLAHDTSFFFDYEPYRQHGEGVLFAFRTDAESAGGRAIPSASEDISLTEPTLKSWLSRISRCASVQTDRAHVMIAAAMLGKEVEFEPSAYFKVPAIADYALGSFPVKRLPPAPAGVSTPARLAPAPCPLEHQATRERIAAMARGRPAPAPLQGYPSASTPRVTAVIISHNRPEFVLGALHSLVHLATVPVDILVLDNDSTQRTRRILAEACAELPQVAIHLSESNLGCAGGRRLATEMVDTELVLFLDDDAELLPGALEHMLRELDRNDQAQAVSATVLLPDGRVSHAGGRYTESEDSVSFTLMASGMQFDDPALPASGPCDWLAWTALLIRRSLLDEFPLDTEMAAYYEDTEWCLRIARAKPGCFRRSREALAVHHVNNKPWGGQDFVSRAIMVHCIRTAAHFYRKHGKLLRVPGMDVFTIMPQLTRTDETLDLVGARLVMELAGTHSADWLLMEWINGGLDPVLGVERTALGDQLHDCRLQVNALRAELERVSSSTR